MRCGHIEVFMAIHAIVNKKMAGQYFAENALAFVACTGNGF